MHIIWDKRNNNIWEQWIGIKIILILQEPRCLLCGCCTLKFEDVFFSFWEKHREFRSHCLDTRGACVEIPHDARLNFNGHKRKENIKTTSNKLRALLSFYMAGFISSRHTMWKQRKKRSKMPKMQYLGELHFGCAATKHNTGGHVRSCGNTGIIEERKKMTSTARLLFSARCVLRRNYWWSLRCRQAWWWRCCHPPSSQVRVEVQRGESHMHHLLLCSIGGGNGKAGGKKNDWSDLKANQSRTHSSLLPTMEGDEKLWAL